MVKAWHEDVVIPTYEVGKPEKNPIFLEKRVYQGSSGVVYPYPVIESISDEKTDVTYHAIYLENEYIKVMILPELGGRVQMAYDKIRKRHFIYYNQVIKPALVGLAGPWISGGIEFNWPQHHRPSTYSPVDSFVEHNADGSVTVWVNEREKMFHQQGQAGFTLRPGHAYLEIQGRLYNPTEMPQTFLWWANPAVEVNDEYQSVFPPDVNAVFDHGKRAVSSFPIATGTYYKMDYSAGVDISNYRNIFVPTSYMIAKSKYNFEGGYENDTKAGMLHVADHHFSPGKKQWTWGNGDFGRAWDRNLTDPVEDGDLPAGVPALDSEKKMNPHRPYIELMAGVYTENQPDFTWLMPYEEKRFVQYFLPYRELGLVKNANKDLLLNIEPADNAQAVLKVFATSRQEIRIEVKDANGAVAFAEDVTVSPEEVYIHTLSNIDATKASVHIYKNGRAVLEYVPETDDIKTIPDAAEAALSPQETKTNEQLYLTGLHLEQYRHATWSALDYYEEALRRDPLDVRCNNAIGLWYIRRGRFDKAEPYLRTAVKVLQKRNLNPYDGEPIYDLGLCLKYRSGWNLGAQLDEAYDYLYKSTWNRAWQDTGYMACAQISCMRGDFDEALRNVDQALIAGWHNHKARALKVAIMQRLNMSFDAFAVESLAINPFNYGIMWAQGRTDEMTKLMRNEANNYDETALDFCAAGLWNDAIGIWQLAINNDATTPLTRYYLAWAMAHSDTYADKSINMLKEAAKISPDYCFPNRLEAILALQFAIDNNANDAHPHYFLGNLYYDKRQYDVAQTQWEIARNLEPTFPTVWRNLALVYANKRDDLGRALECMERAYSLDTTDSRVLMELDQLYKRMQRPHDFRLQKLQAHPECIAQRDDLVLEEVTLLNQLGRHEEAKAIIDAHIFHPWEGGEGKVSGQYQICRLEIAKSIILNKDANVAELEKAVALLNECLVFPAHLGEGKLYGAQDNDFYYFLGLAYRRLTALTNDKDKYEALANDSFRLGTNGPTEPAAAMYYNDAKPDKIFYAGLCYRALGDEKSALRLFHKLVNYGEQHIYDHITMDYFAVSLPDLLVWDDSLDRKNQIHCNYMLALGHYGLGNLTKSQHYSHEVEALDINHAGLAALKSLK